MSLSLTHIPVRRRDSLLSLRSEGATRLSWLESPSEFRARSSWGGDITTFHRHFYFIYIHIHVCTYIDIPVDQPHLPVKCSLEESSCHTCDSSSELSSQSLSEWTNTLHSHVSSFDSPCIRETQQKQATWPQFASSSLTWSQTLTLQLWCENQPKGAHFKERPCLSVTIWYSLRTYVGTHTCTHTTRRLRARPVKGAEDLNVAV